MKFPKKIEFLQESLKLNDKQFAVKYKIRLSTLKSWKKGLKPELKDVIEICKDYHLDPKDFVSDQSTLINPKGNEHLCATIPREDKSNTIYEDFAREDNSRYEEKD